MCTVRCGVSTSGARRRVGACEDRDAGLIHAEYISHGRCEGPTRWMQFVDVQLGHGSSAGHGHSACSDFVNLAVRDGLVGENVLNDVGAGGDGGVVVLMRRRVGHDFQAVLMGLHNEGIVLRLCHAIGLRDKLDVV